MRTWNLSGFARDAVSIVSYQLRKQKMRIVAVVALRSNTSFVIQMAKRVWRGVGILTAMTILFITGKSLWQAKDDAVTKTVSIQNTSTKRGKHLG
jgi:hypothetical protein